jgi:DNA-binding NarL/FixJ family response regulator
MIRIVVADEQAVVREGVKRITGETNDLLVVGEAVTNTDVLSQVSGGTCDVVLMDLSLTGRGCLDTLQELKSRYPRLPVLVFSTCDRHHYVTYALQAGANGYLTKTCTSEELITALRTVARGGRYIDAAIAELLLYEHNHDREQPLHATLSARELQVLCLFGQGKTMTEIAQDLCLSIKTISTYRTRILEKMQLHTTADIMHYAIHQQLVH